MRKKVVLELKIVRVLFVERSDSFPAHAHAFVSEAVHNPDSNGKGEIVGKPGQGIIE